MAETQFMHLKSEEVQLSKCVHFLGSSSPIVQPTGGVKSVTNKFPDSQRIFSENAELVLLTKPKIKDCTFHDEEPLSCGPVHKTEPTNEMMSGGSLNHVQYVHRT